MHDLDENPHSLRRCGKQAAKKESKREPKKIARKMHGICTVTHLRIGLWRGMEGNQNWKESTLVRIRGQARIIHFVLGVTRIFRDCPQVMPGIYNQSSLFHLHP